MRTIIAVAMFIGVIAVGAACSATDAVLPTPLVKAVYRTITLDDFATALDQPDSYTVINVHIPYEGEVLNTDDHIVYNDIDALILALPDRTTS